LDVYFYLWIPVYNKLYGAEIGLYIFSIIVINNISTVFMEPFIASLATILSQGLSQRKIELHVASRP